MRLRILTDLFRQKLVCKTLKYTKYSCGFTPFPDEKSLVRLSCRFVRYCLIYSLSSLLLFRTCTTETCAPCRGSKSTRRGAFFSFLCGLDKYAFSAHNIEVRRRCYEAQGPDSPAGVQRLVAPLKRCKSRHLHQRSADGADSTPWRNQRAAGKIHHPPAGLEIIRYPFHTGGF